MTEKTTKRRNAVIAAAAGVALLIGGSTYALWSATGNIAGGDITSGTLEMTVGTVAGYDVSGDRYDSTIAAVQNTASTPATLTFASTDEAAKVVNVKQTANAISGHPITSLGTWMITPNDTVLVSMPLNVTMKGDNLVADLTMDTTGLVGKITNKDMVYQAAIFGDDGKQIGTVQTLDTATGNAALKVATFQANGDGQNSGQDDKDSAGALVPTVGVDGTASVTLVIFGHFADKTPQDASSYAATDALGSIPVALTQVRSGTDLFTAPQQPPA
ncbi:MAG: SipW-dependent-type signal peptide-containing protein [Propionibacteriaceae bacterium]|jgi:predicted ribosomally synthesized peptide with SipW-like signal peptide|nr:SipW-dependent-type signal peptide-containing protein [Propionibacteriaceae bacterium]